MGQLSILILVFFVGFIASFIGAISGGGGLISIPFLIFLGLPPQVAIATNKFGGIGLSLGAAIKFIKEKKIIWRYVLPLVIASIIGAYIGANILLNVNQETLSKIVGIILILLLPTIFLRKKVGLERRTVSKNKKILGFIVYFLIMVFGGFFGGGGGILAIYTLTILFGLTFIEVNATDIISWLSMSVFSLMVFMMNGIVNYRYGVVLFFGMTMGGYAGAHTAIRKGNRWVRLVFILVVIASVIKLLFF